MIQNNNFQSASTGNMPTSSIPSSATVTVVKLSRQPLRQPSCKSQRSNRSRIIHVSSASSRRRSIRSLNNSIHYIDNKSINAPDFYSTNEVEKTSINTHSRRPSLISVQQSIDSTSEINRSLDLNKTHSAKSNKSWINNRDLDHTISSANKIHRSKSVKVGQYPDITMGSSNGFDNIDDLKMKSNRSSQKRSLLKYGQNNKNRKGGFYDLCCTCSPLCKLLTIIGLLLLGGIIAGIIATSLTNKINTTVTSTTTTSATTTTVTTTTTTTESTTTSTSTSTSTTTSTSSSSTSDTTSTSTSSSSTSDTTSTSTSTSTTSDTTSSTTTTTATTTSTTSATTSTTTSATTTTQTTTTTEFACSPLCVPEQTCIENVCLNVGYLSCALTWSRSGDGDIVVATPNGNVIHYQNKGPSNDTDQGKLDRDDKNKGPENVFWPSSGSPPPTGTYYVCFEPFLFGLIISSIVPVTVTYRIVFPSGAYIILSRKFTSTQRNSYNCDASSNTLVGSFNYP